MLESLGKTLRGKLERNINKKKKTVKTLKAETGKMYNSPQFRWSFTTPMRKIATKTVTFLTPFWQRSTNHFLLILALNVLFTHFMKQIWETKPQLPLHPASALNFYDKEYDWDRGAHFKQALLSSREIWAAASQWANERGGEDTICGGPTLSGGLLSVQTTCWKPRGGAQPDSLGSAQLPGAAAPALSQGLSCSRNTARNCNPSQSQHPEMLPLAAPFTIRTPPAQAQHRRPLCYRMQVCALQCIINLML